MNSMNFDISLGLGLGFHKQRHKQSKKIKEEEEDPCNKADPYSLTLGVGSAADNIDEKNIHQVATTTTKTESNEFIYNLHQRASNSTSVISSFSNSSNSIKRERNDEAEKISFVDIDDVNDNSSRKKLRLTKEQSAVLEDTFKDHSTLNPVYIFKFLVKLANYLVKYLFLTKMLINFFEELNMFLISIK